MHFTGGQARQLETAHVCPLPNPHGLIVTFTPNITGLNNVRTNNNNDNNDRLTAFDPGQPG